MVCRFNFSRLRLQERPNRRSQPFFATHVLCSTDVEAMEVDGQSGIVTPPSTPREQGIVAPDSGGAIRIQCSNITYSSDEELEEQEEGTTNLDEFHNILQKVTSLWSVNTDSSGYCCIWFLGAQCATDRRKRCKNAVLFTSELPVLFSLFQEKLKANCTFIHNLQADKIESRKQYVFVPSLYVKTHCFTPNNC